MIRKKILIVMILLFSIIINGCSVYGVKIDKVKFVFYTVGISKDNPYKHVQGKELEQWVDYSLDIQPNEFEIVIMAKNNSFLATKSSKVHVEFWTSRASSIFTDDGNALDIDKMQKKAKWYQNWQEDIQLPELKPYEEREIKVKRIDIYKMLKDVQEDSTILGWKCKAICGNSKNEKTIIMNFLD